MIIKGLVCLSQVPPSILTMSYGRPWTREICHWWEVDLGGRGWKQRWCFFTPPKSLIRKDLSGSVVLDNTVHLEMNGVVHAYIVKQLTNLHIAHSLGFLAIHEKSKSKCLRKSTKVIKIGDRKSPSIPSRFDHSWRRNHKISHIAKSEQKKFTFEPSTYTFVNLNSMRLPTPFHFYNH